MTKGDISKLLKKHKETMSLQYQLVMARKRWTTASDNRQITHR